MRLFDLRILGLLVCLVASNFAVGQSVNFAPFQTTYVNCGDDTDPQSIAMVNGLMGPFVGTSTSFGTTACTAGAANELTFSFVDDVFPRRNCMDELVLIVRTWTATDQCGFAR